MPAAARISDITTHGGSIIGPGEPTVLIGGMPASVQGDIHICSLPPNIHPNSTPFSSGSATVMIGGKPAIRASDTAACGAAVVIGEPTVLIG